MDINEVLAMIEAMQKYGGSFVYSLAECFMRADKENFDRLCIAFPEYVKQYSDIADKDKFCDCYAGVGITNPVHDICGNCNKPFRHAKKKELK